MTHIPMVTLATEYLDVRRGLGFDLKVQGWLLLDFARYADRAGHHGPITVDIATRWAMASKSGPRQLAQRLSVIRQFARHRIAFEPSTEVPPVNHVGRPARRKPPHIYSDTEITELLRAAAALRPRNGLRPQTYVALFSLLACTGLRISEARHLSRRDADLDAGLLVIRESKFRKSRLVLLHPGAVVALKKYAAVRDRYHHAPRSESFFHTERAAALKKEAVKATFCKLRDRLGWTTQGRAHRPRIHDFRHTFAVRRLLRWYDEGADVDRKILALATYLGHAKVTDTYWYLSATPELLAATSRRFELFVRRRGEDVR